MRNTWGRGTCFFSSSTADTGWILRSCRKETSYHLLLIKHHQILLLGDLWHCQKHNHCPNVALIDHYVAILMYNGCVWMACQLTYWWVKLCLYASCAAAWGVWSPSILCLSFPWLVVLLLPELNFRLPPVLSVTHCGQPFCCCSRKIKNRSSNVIVRMMMMMIIIIMTENCQSTN